MTLVKLECTVVDSGMSVIGDWGGVYSLRVLRLRGQRVDRAALDNPTGMPWGLGRAEWARGI